MAWVFYLINNRESIYSIAKVTLRVDVSECEAQVVLVNDLGRDLLGHDLVEERRSRRVDRGICR